MSGRRELLVDWCSHAAATFAVERWHYSRTMPVSPQQTIGVWQAGSFIGAVVFAKGANYRIHEFFGVAVHEVAELVRVAIRAGHAMPVSKILRFAVRAVAKKNPNLRVLVSYADTNMGHHGGIYQACNWSYLGLTSPTTAYDVGGVMMHKRAFTGKNYGRPAMPVPAGAVLQQRTGKHRYALGLDESMRLWLKARQLPYPKRAASIAVDAPAFQAGEAGSDRAQRSPKATHD